MSARTVHLLHVEDDQSYRMLLAQQLRALNDIGFVITAVDNQDDAIIAFQRGGIELVILDYNLTRGNGLHCLKQLRELDVAVPIIAISGAANAEIATELLEAGADDFLDKYHLSTKSLVQSVRSVLANLDAWRRGTARETARNQLVEGQLQAVSRQFVAALTPELFANIAQLEAAARDAKITLRQLQQWMGQIADDLAREPDLASPAPNERLRPLLLEVALRLFGDAQRARENH